MNRWASGFPGIWISNAKWTPSFGKMRERKQAGDGFAAKVLRDLATINSRRVGKELLTLIGKRAFPVAGPRSRAGISCEIIFGKPTLIDDEGTIDPPGFGEVAVPSSKTGSAGGADQQARLKQYRVGARLPVAGSGYSAIVAYDPDYYYTRSSMLALEVPTPSFVALAHELIHALHIMSGDVIQVKNADRERLIEEARTVGAGRYKATRISENAIRREHNIAERSFYSEPGDCDLGSRMPPLPLPPEEDPDLDW